MVVGAINEYTGGAQLVLVPAKGDGEIVHVFHVDRCRPGWDRDVTDEFGRPQIGGC